MKDLKWTHVTLIAIVLAVLGGLSFYDKDVAAVLSGVVLILGALGFNSLMSKQSDLQNQQTEIKQTADTIKEQTNGRIAQLTAMLERQNENHRREITAMADEHRREMAAMADKLAAMTPPPMEPISGGGFYAKGGDHPSDL